MRAISLVAVSEWPPSAKKLSLTPTGAGSSSSSATIAASFDSTGVRGATGIWPVPAPQSGSGSARWSIFPLPVSGSAGSTTKVAGTM